MDFLTEPIPPEAAGAEASSHLKEVIMKKLLAAQQQKQHQQASSPPRSPPRREPQSWELEKRMMAEMLEKTQALLKRTQESAFNEKKQFESKLDTLTAEIQRLRTDARQAGKVVLSGDKENERRILLHLEEIERVTEQREAQFTQELASYQEKLEAALQKNEELERRLSDKTQISKVDEFYEHSVAISKAVDIKHLKNENKKQQKRYETLLKVSCEKEADLTEEVERLYSSNRFITEASVNREQALTSQIKELVQFNERLLQDNSQLKDKLLALEDKAASQQKHAAELFEGLSRRYEETKGPHTLSILYQELTKLKNTVIEKDTEIETLRSRSQTEPLELPTVRFSNNEIKQELASVSETLAQLNEQHSLEEQARAVQFQEIVDENVALRHSLNEYVSKNYENELATLRLDLSKLQVEKTHAKRLIIHYVRTIQQLESEVKLSKSPEVIRLQLEITRLQEECNSLNEAIKQQQQLTQVEFQSLQEVVDNQNGIIKELNSQIEATRRNQAKDTVREMNTAQTRVAALLKTNNALNLKIKQNEAGKVVENYEKIVKLLKDKLEETNRTHGTSREQWLKEKEDLRRALQEAKSGPLLARISDYNTTQEILDATHSLIDSLSCLKEELTDVVASTSQECTEFQRVTQEFLNRHDAFAAETNELLRLYRRDVTELSSFKEKLSLSLTSPPV